MGSRDEMHPPSFLTLRSIHPMMHASDHVHIKPAPWFKKKKMAQTSKPSRLPPDHMSCWRSTITIDASSKLSFEIISHRSTINFRTGMVEGACFP